ncbi:MAG: hypothetical protein ACHQ0J_06185 [Candidatus Dormibacterales bacterium]
MTSILASLAIALVTIPTLAGPPANLSWDRWKTVPGVFDLGGPMTHGAVVVAGSAALYLLSLAGDVIPFAGGQGGYHDDAGAEAYLAVSPGLRDSAAGCSFAPDETFVLRLHAPVGITVVDPFGQTSSPFANIPATGLNGIAFDSEGAFDHRLLATAPLPGHSAVYAIDCKGSVSLVTSTAPVFEGGLVVAPSTFGRFGGTLIAPDELSGVIWSIGPNGKAAKLVDSGVPAGGDIGVESVAFVPSGFARGGNLYFADRGTAGSPHPGTDSLLRLSSAQLVSAGVQEGDLLGASEGGATMIDVRCNPDCHPMTLIGTPTTAHGEGHLVFTMDQPPSPSPTSSPAAGATAAPTPTNQASGLGPGVVAGVLLIALVGAGIGFLALRRRSPKPPR